MYCLQKRFLHVEGSTYKTFCNTVFSQEEGLRKNVKHSKNMNGQLKNYIMLFSDYVFVVTLVLCWEIYYCIEKKCVGACLLTNLPVMAIEDTSQFLWERILKLTVILIFIFMHLRHNTNYFFYSNTVFSLDQFVFKSYNKQFLRLDYNYLFVQSVANGFMLTRGKHIG